jgi:hypothetical protein
MSHSDPKIVQSRAERAGKGEEIEKWAQEREYYKFI